MSFKFDSPQENASESNNDKNSKSLYSYNDDMVNIKDSKNPSIQKGEVEKFTAEENDREKEKKYFLNRNLLESPNNYSFNLGKETVLFNEGNKRDFDKIPIDNRLMLILKIFKMVINSYFLKKR